MSQPQQQHALDGVRVLDLSRVLAGPWSAQVLGDLGADVVKVEAPGKGDDTRPWGPPFLPPPPGDEGKARESAYYLSANRNKRSIAIDMGNANGAALIRQLAAKADIVVENFKVGGLKKFGLDYEALKAVNPRLIYCSITGFGQYGPYAERGGYDFVAQAMGGIMSITGEVGGTPLKTGVAICDLFTGMYATTAMLAALRHAERTGEGQYIDCALLDTQIAMLANQGYSYLVGGVVAKPMGNAHPTVVPYRTFEAADGPLVVAVGNDGQFRNFCLTLGRDNLANDPRFATATTRVINRAPLEAELQQSISSRHVHELIDALSERGVPCGPINRIDQVFADPQIEARDIVHRFPRADGVETPTVAYPPKLSATPADYRRAPPRLNEHRSEILRDWLGVSDEEEARLVASGALS